MGRQPFGLASAAAWLRRGGWTVACVDVAKERLADDAIAGVEAVGVHLPMHTATRLAGPVVARVRAVNPRARIAAFGLYAPLNEQWLRSIGVEAVFGGEFEEDLSAWARSCFDGRRTSEREARGPGGSETSHMVSSSSVGDGQDDPAALEGSNHERATPRARVPRVHFLVPDRSGLPPLSCYASLQWPDGTRRVVGYTEASRGCKHLCRHCPVVPIYDGQFRVVPADVVLADVEGQVRAGAQHITFGDPDFLNGPTHAMRVVDALHAAHPGLTFDVTIKIEHVLRHRDLLPHLVATGCAFVTSAVESIDDRVLARLDKGHTRQDFIEAVALCRRVALTLVPTFVAFHPWLTLEDYCELLEAIAALDLVDHVAPIQLAIRLLLPEGSRLLTLDDMRPHVRGFDASTLTYRWSHPDPRVDALHDEVTSIVGTKLTANRRDVFAAISALAHDRARRPNVSPKPARDRATVPYLNEPWYC